ncbi:hypothetical protein TTHERM_00633440 (macronuclear) [Tetrahymena thermophila SB210]|uniref:Uncharacterized protein n=1 Tax=Tetrahymena thermophila (strain SB210) TaxID=312017 RepID=Q22X09_TETTS|nr:hypothetical protein TTHERM_00633440 [Tetrahymena thermophila SB210]EAR89837.2 hypothetical protein TTHERM_00633440 [Tetrahymena thermophila SB210]|eukprot:XP_001010082.2 hypothetical protein TTHERM_00633440 [Tetrahymena thermophila SB210]
MLKIILKSLYFLYQQFCYYNCSGQYTEEYFQSLKDFIKVNFAHHQSNYLQILQMIDLKQKNNNINYFFQKCKVNDKIKYIKKYFDAENKRLLKTVDRQSKLLVEKQHSICSNTLDYYSKRLVY